MRMAHWPAPKLPDARALHGRYVRLERLSRHHGDALWESFSADPRHYDYLYQGPFRTKREFDDWFMERLQRMDYHHAVNVANNKAEGTCGLIAASPQHYSVQVGGVYGPAMRQSSRSTEAVYLLIKEAFALGYRRVQTKCWTDNVPAMRTAHRLGFQFEGLSRQHEFAKGRLWDSAYFSILDYEWPPIKAAYDAWLAPENQTAGGQLVPLTQFISSTRAQFYGQLVASQPTGVQAKPVINAQEALENMAHKQVKPKI